MMNHPQNAMNDPYLWGPIVWRTFGLPNGRRQCILEKIKVHREEKKKHRNLVEEARKILKANQTELDIRLAMACM